MLLPHSATASAAVLKPTEVAPRRHDSAEGRRARRARARARGAGAGSGARGAQGAWGRRGRWARVGVGP